jgi:xanthine dehydrogenase accessory factor
VRRRLSLGGVPILRRARDRFCAGAAARCGGRIGIFVRALTDSDAFIQDWTSARARRMPFDVAIDLLDGSHRCATDRDATDARLFHQRYLPKLRLVVVGGDPVTLALCALAPMFDYEVVLLRPYGPTAPPPRATLAHYDPRPLARALDTLALDPFTAVYTLTHDMDDDHAVLEKALASDAFSAGALGSRSKSAEREHRLRIAGFDDATLRRLHSPAGVSINAREPREIALAVLAETVALWPRAQSATQ